MKSDIKPLSSQDPDSPNFRPKKDFDKDEKETPIKKRKKTKKKKEPIKKSKSDNNKKKFFKDKQKEDKRKQLDNISKQNHRPDLSFFWILIVIIVFGSLAVLAYYTLSTNQPDNSQETQNNLKETTEQEPGDSTIGSFENDYYYLTADETSAKIVKENISTNQKETVTSFTPPANIDNLSASWDNEHRFAYIDNEGVKIYNQNKDSTFLLAPSRGEREYYQVNFANDDKIATLYRLKDSSYLEVYSSALRLINKKIKANNFDWTKDNLLSFSTANHKEDIYQFKVYSPEKSDYQTYFKPYLSSRRYPLAFKNSNNSDKTAFLLRDKKVKQSTIILAIGERKNNRLTNVSELLYLDNSIEDELISSPTIIWDKKEDYIYASVNSQMFKVNLDNNEAEELNLGFSGTIQALSSDNKYLYIKKEDSDNNIKKPESIVVYNIAEKKTESSSGLSQVSSFLNYNY